MMVFQYNYNILKEINVFCALQIIVIQETNVENAKVFFAENALKVYINVKCVLMLKYAKIVMSSF